MVVVAVSPLATKRIWAGPVGVQGRLAAGGTTKVTLVVEPLVTVAGTPLTKTSFSLAEAPK
jgi:hypothetical protein